MVDSNVGVEFDLFRELGIIGAGMVFNGATEPVAKAHPRKRSSKRGEVKTNHPCGPVVRRYDPKLSEILGDLS